uniref:Reverse transcriptase domain-containing protein n=1 Tax=Sorghum bicolor TaxID=4558 RepID=C6JRP7_SORBI
MELFNDFIGHFQLREIFCNGNKFTWSNKQKNPVLAKLDRILVSTSWEMYYPTCFAWVKARVGSDHCPLVINTGEDGDSKPRYFFFDEQWLKREGFHSMVHNRWLYFRDDLRYSLDRWQGCLQFMRKYLRGWNLQLLGEQKREKANMIQRIMELDKIAEMRLLSIQEWEERIDIENSLDSLQKSEIYWKQKAGIKWLLEGDANTHFFHQFANGRRRKNMISFLECDSGDIRGQKDITEHIVSFYKNLFGPSENCSISMGNGFWPLEMKLNGEESSTLVKPFELEEIKGVVMDMKTNSAPGPNGFSVVFFQKFWDTISGDMMGMFEDFWGGNLDIKRLNFGVITLIPKIKEANNIKQYRPICLLNVDFKCFTKVLTNRLVPIAQRVVGKNQTGFIKGRNILDGIVVLHEVILELQSSKDKGLVLKIDFEKAYDRVNWGFLEQVMEMKAFPAKWIHWVMSTVRGGQVCINVNGERSSYFKTFRGLRQGDPLSPILFNLVADVLGILLDKAVAKAEGTAPLPARFLFSAPKPSQPAALDSITLPCDNLSADGGAPAPVARTPSPCPATTSQRRRRLPKVHHGEAISVRPQAADGGAPSGSASQTHRHCWRLQIQSSILF